VKVELAPEAEADLEAIALFIARDDPVAAVAWVDRLVERAHAIAKAPRAGRVVPEVGDPAIREVFLKSYRIIYRTEAHRILVLTILEGHRRLRPK
jgi:toxin ParE1/3/4